MKKKMVSFLKNRPSSVQAWTAGAVLLAVWGVSCLVVFRNAIIPLTYALPLLVCVWARSRFLLWTMAGVLAAFPAVKFFLLIPESALYGGTRVFMVLANMGNILASSLILHLTILLLNSLEATLDDLEESGEQVRRQNEELVLQGEELSLQNEELAQHMEELSQQGEEIQTQSEEILILNIELSQREDLLQHLLDPARMLSCEQVAIGEICQAAVKIFDEAASAVAFYELEDAGLVIRAKAGHDSARLKFRLVEHSFIQLVIRENRTACLHDTTLRPDLHFPETEGREKFLSVLGSPVRLEESPMGAVAVYGKQVQEWTDHHFRLVEWVAAQCGHLLGIMRMQQALQRQASLIDMSPEGIVVRRLNGEITFWSRGAEMMYGWSRGEAVGRQTHMLLDSRFPLPVDEIGRELRRKGKWSGEIVQRTRDDQEVIVRSSWLAGYDEHGRIEEVLESNIDITGRVRMEEELRRSRDRLEDLVRERTAELEERNSQLEDEIAERRRAEEEKKMLEVQLMQAQKMEALGRFAGGIAHDLNNILYPIIINAEMLVEETPPESSFHEMLRQMLQASYRQKDLVKQILAFSRRTEQKLDPVTVTPIIQETLVLLRSSLPSTIEICTRFSASLDMVLGNATQIQQVVLNLCKNAADAFPSGQGTIEVCLANTHVEPLMGNSEMKAGEYLLITVKDTGDGMGTEVMDHIFEPFFTTKEPGKGSGMGLAVAHGIVKRHGGAIMAESESGKGSLFSVYLPVTDETCRIQEPEEVGVPPLIARGSILLVDDEESIRSSVRKALERLGYCVTVAESGHEAVELISRAQSAFDLVITDLIMPQINGLELASRIRAVFPDMPIILCTGFNDSIDESRIKDMGINELIMKPAGTGELRAVIGRVIGSGRPSDQADVPV